MDGFQWKIRIPLKWMIWGYPHFRKPPYPLQLWWYWWYWWYMMIYDDLWWSMMIFIDIPMMFETSTNFYSRCWRLFGSLMFNSNFGPMIPNEERETHDSFWINILHWYVECLARVHAFSSFSVVQPQKGFFGNNVTALPGYLTFPKKRPS